MVPHTPFIRDPVGSLLPPRGSESGNRVSAPRSHLPGPSPTTVGLNLLLSRSATDSRDRLAGSSRASQKVFIAQSAQLGKGDHCLISAVAPASRVQVRQPRVSSPLPPPGSESSNQELLGLVHFGTSYAPHPRPCRLPAPASRVRVRQPRVGSPLPPHGSESGNRVSAPRSHLPGPSPATRSC